MSCRTVIKKKRLRALTGSTLVELMVAVGILAFFLCGILLTYIQMTLMSDLARDFTFANNAVQAKMEEVKNTPFANLLALNGTQFNITDSAGVNVIGIGVIAIKAVSPLATSALDGVRITASFRSRGRIIGEDRNLDGIRDTGERCLASWDYGLDSPVELITLIAR
jgi:type II secretory pathway pseudopilin PulG